MEFGEKLLSILEKSIEKNGNQPLTTQHLKNIVNLCIQSIQKDKDKIQKDEDEILMELYKNECCDRN